MYTYFTFSCHFVFFSREPHQITCQVMLSNRMHSSVPNATWAVVYGTENCRSNTRKKRSMFQNESKARHAWNIFFLFKAWTLEFDFIFSSNLNVQSNDVHRMRHIIKQPKNKKKQTNVTETEIISIEKQKSFNWMPFNRFQRWRDNFIN